MLCVKYININSNDVDKLKNQQRTCTFENVLMYVCDETRADVIQLLKLPVHGIDQAQHVSIL